LNESNDISLTLAYTGAMSVAISVLMPVKNVEEYFENISLNLLSNMDLCDEIIIIDDSSEDGSYNLLTKWASQQNLDIRIVRNSGNGLVHALNLGLSIAKHDWIARFDADDVYPSYRLSTQRTYINHSTAAIFSDYTINYPGKKFSAYIPSALFERQVRLSLISSNRTPHPAALMNKKYVDFVGGYESDYFLAEDLALWFKLSRVGTLVSVPLSLLHYNRNSNSLTTKRYIEMKEKKELVLKTFAPQMVAEELSQTNYFELYFQYRGVSHKSLRRLLLVKDLISCGRFIQRKSLHLLKLSALSLVVLIDFRNVWALCILLYTKIRLDLKSR
jgi:glycosyltransferase involved in cell wall biosynthesis